MRPFEVSAVMGILHFSETHSVLERFPAMGNNWEILIPDDLSTDTLEVCHNHSLILLDPAIVLIVYAFIHDVSSVRICY